MDDRSHSSSGKKFWILRLISHQLVFKTALHQNSINRFIFIWQAITRILFWIWSASTKILAPNAWVTRRPANAVGRAIGPTGWRKTALSLASIVKWPIRARRRQTWRQRRHLIQKEETRLKTRSRMTNRSPRPLYRARTKVWCVNALRWVISIVNINRGFHH